MRKVFLSTSLVGEIDLNNPTIYISDDVNLGIKKYKFPLSHIIENNIEDGDEIVIITAVLQTKNPMKNYSLYQDEVLEIIKDKRISIKFIEIKQEKDFDSLTFNKFFKEIANLIEDNDTIFADFSFGMKCYSLSMFTALAYVTKAGHNINIDTIIYAQKFVGEIAVENCSKIYDITGLFSLNTLASNAKTGQKADLDNLLDLIID